MNRTDGLRASIRRDMGEHWMVEGVSYSTVSSVLAHCKARGAELSEMAVRNRLKSGATTWDALCAPPKPGGDQKQVWADRRAEMAAVLAAYDARKGAA